ncbi:MAG: protease modulator HflC [Parvularculaceae bacterium]|nr:protease modulator HflC [Parvularculaceae bacterium]
MQRSLGFIGAAIVVVGFIAQMAFFTVREDQQAIVLQFGEPVRTLPAGNAGLHFKTPFIQNVIDFDAKNLNFDADPVEVIVANEERLLVDAFVRYEIDDPLEYYSALGRGSGDPFAMRTRFNERIGAVLNEAIRQVLGEVTISDIITEQRSLLMTSIQSNVAQEADSLGVSIIDVRIRQADFPEANAANVYNRMISEYSEQAQRIRAEGDREALEIRAAAEKEAVSIRAAAREQSETIRGLADAERNAIFADAYNRDPEFFAFYRSLTAYEKSLADGSTTIIMSPDSEFFRYFNDQAGGPN